MNRFGRTPLTAMSLAAVATVLSPVPAPAAGSSVINHAFVPSVSWFTSDFGEFVNVQVVRTNTGYVLLYNVFDFGGGLSWGGSGSIPDSSVTVSQGSVNTGRVTVTLNVNTCNLPGFITTGGPCGPFNLNWVEQPASVGGSTATRGDTRQTVPGVGTIVTNGQTLIFNALTTGTANGFDAPPGAVGFLVQQTNVTVTITAP